jgi:hypothetical protein
MLNNRRGGRWRKLALTFMLIFILAVFVAAYHHHEDGEDHDDYPICSAAHQHSSASLSVFNFEEQLPSVILSA